MPANDNPVPGSVLSETRAPTQAEFDLFAAISGDDNPIHIDPDFSKRTRFGRTVAHGMMLYAHLWALAHRRFPGARHLGQSLMFPNPAYAGDTIRFEVEVLDYPASGRCRLATRALRVGDGLPVCEGHVELELAP